MTKLIFPILIAVSSLAKADVSFNVARLSQVEVTTVIYSQTSQEVLVGIIDQNQVGSFLVCQTPAANPEMKISLSVVQSCQVLDETTYLATPEMADAINKAFGPALESSLKEQKYRYMRDSGVDFSDGTHFIFGSLTLGATAVLTTTAVSDFRAGGLRGMGFGSLKILGAVGSAALLFEVVTEGMEHNRYIKKSLMPLEDVVKNQMQILMKKEGVQTEGITPFELEKGVTFGSGLLFKAIKDSIRESIVRATMA